MGRVGGRLTHCVKISVPCVIPHAPQMERVIQRFSRTSALRSHKDVYSYIPAMRELSWLPS